MNKELLFELLTYFIIYSFLGWVMESIVRSVAEKKIINTGFLRGPVCPIYGIGAMIMFIFLDKFENNPILLFFISITILTLWEYLVGVVLEKTFNTKYWDYSNKKFNFQGRICLKNSICWGILGVAFVEYIHPFLQSIVSKVDNSLIHYCSVIILLVMIVDFITTVVKIMNIKESLEKVENINKEILEKLKEIRYLRRDTKNIPTVENIKAIVEKLKKQRNRTIRKLYRNVYRLKSAFPAINTSEVTEVLTKKAILEKIKRIDIIKNKKNT